MSVIFSNGDRIGEPTVGTEFARRMLIDPGDYILDGTVKDVNNFKC
jgi:hypothetical protein